MKRFSDRHQLTTLSELNITPLLDLAFVLLIIFMITTPLMENSSDLVIPTGRGTSRAVNPANVETISVDRDARVTLNRKELSEGEWAAAFAGLAAAKPEGAVVVRAHRELPVQRLVEVMDALKAAGITRIGLVSTEAQAP